MKTYTASRNHHGKTVTVNGRKLKHYPFHSPTGFEWGYAGSGPADLALAILADHFGERPTKQQLRSGDCRCWRLHQQFKSTFIARAPEAGFSITSQQIDEWLAARDAPRRRRGVTHQEEE